MGLLSAKGYVMVEKPIGAGDSGGLAMWMANSQTLLCRLRFSMVVEFKRTNSSELPVIPIVKRPNMAALQA